MRFTALFLTASLLVITACEPQEEAKAPAEPARDRCHATTNKTYHDKGFGLTVDIACEAPIQCGITPVSIGNNRAEFSVSCADNMQELSANFQSVLSGVGYQCAIAQQQGAGRAQVDAKCTATSQTPVTGNIVWNGNFEADKTKYSQDYEVVITIQ